MRIETAREHDLAAIVDIYNQAVAQRGATADLQPVSVESRAQWFRDHTPEHHPIWVALDDDQVTGWCSLSAYRAGRQALRHTAEISYYVHRDHRRKGIARSLIEHAIEQCPALGIEHLMTFLLDINQPSIQLLEAFGFARWGHLPDVARIDGRVCGHLIYGRAIGRIDD
jgi:L-amino acid N-acyltransferase YncA